MAVVRLMGGTPWYRQQPPSWLLTETHPYYSNTDGAYNFDRHRRRPRLWPGSHRNLDSEHQSIQVTCSPLVSGGLGASADIAMNAIRGGLVG